MRASCGMSASSGYDAEYIVRSEERGSETHHKEKQEWVDTGAGRRPEAEFGKRKNGTQKRKEPPRGFEESEKEKARSTHSIHPTKKREPDQKSKKQAKEATKRNKREARKPTRLGIDLVACSFLVCRFFVASGEGLLIRITDGAGFDKCLWLFVTSPIQ